MKIHVLTSGFTSPNSTAFLFPFIVFKPSLKNYSYDIKIQQKLSDSTIDCDYLFIDSKYFKHSWGADKLNQTLEKISYLSKKTKVIWCDQSDSTGTFLGQVLPYVHKYLKAQLIKDRHEYMKEHYASRIFTDYYHKKYGIEDIESYINQPCVKEEYLNKLALSWNSCFMHYGLIGPAIMKLRSKIPLNYVLHFSKEKTSANKPREIDVTCRMGISYSRETVCYQRRKIKEILSKHLATNKLSRKKYLQELKNSKICTSPFGLGEITLKDFECFLSGALLLKPDISHMETWPNLYENRITCLYHNWDLDDIEEKVEWALTHEKERIEIAQRAQDIYASYTIDKNAGELFANNFNKLINSF